MTVITTTVIGGKEYREQYNHSCPTSVGKEISLAMWEVQ